MNFDVVKRVECFVEFSGRELHFKERFCYFTLIFHCLDLITLQAYLQKSLWGFYILTLGEEKIISLLPE